jgi:hypothetical protein
MRALVGLIVAAATLAGCAAGDTKVKVSSGIETTMTATSVSR